MLLFVFGLKIYAKKFQNMSESYKAIRSPLARQPKQGDKGSAVASSPKLLLFFKNKVFLFCFPALFGQLQESKKVWGCRTR